jgi:hypothetical protein
MIAGNQLWMLISVVTIMTIFVGLEAGVFLHLQPPISHLDDCNPSPPYRRIHSEQ